MMKDTTLRAYKKAGQWIIHRYGPWLNLNKAFQLGLAEDGFFKIEMADDSNKYVHSFSCIYACILIITTGTAQKNTKQST
jgi:hypothetical protein